MIAPDAWVPLAEVARPHGVRGEVRLRLFNADSDALLELDEVLVRLKDGEEHEVSVDRARRADDAILMKLHSIDDRDRADEIRGALVCVRRRDFPPLDDGEFYACDVEGAAIEFEGRVLGHVKTMRHYPAASSLVVTTTDASAFATTSEGKPVTKVIEWEVPLVDVFIDRIDVDAGKVILKSVEGLERG